jgi:hypothetical protein
MITSIEGETSMRGAQKSDTRGVYCDVVSLGKRKSYVMALR